MLIIFRPYKSILFMIICLFNEACVLLSYASSVYLAYLDMKNNFDN